MKYNFSEKGPVLLFINNEKYVISNDDPRIDIIKKCLISKEFNKVYQMINIFPNKKNVYKKEKIHVSDIVIPVSLERKLYMESSENRQKVYDILLTHKDKKDDVLFLLNEINLDDIYLGDPSGKIVFVANYFEKDGFIPVNRLNKSLLERLKKINFNVENILLSIGYTKKRTTILLNRINNRLNLEMVLYFSFLFEKLNKDILFDFINNNFDYLTNAFSNNQEYYFESNHLEKIKLFLENIKFSFNRVFDLILKNEVEISNLNNIARIDFGEDLIFEDLLNESSFRDMYNKILNFIKIKKNHIRFKYDFKIPKNFYFDQYIIRFPKDNIDLIEWSAKMNNCIQGYSERMIRKECIVFAILNKKGEMIINVEILRNNKVFYKINQFSEKHNRCCLNSEKYKELIKYIYNYFIVGDKIKMLKKYGKDEELKKLIDKINL